MDEKTFWVRIWTLVLAGFVTLVGAPAGCTTYESKRIADAVEKGINPIDARCGIAGTSNSGSNMCMVRATK